MADFSFKHRTDRDGFKWEIYLQPFRMSHVFLWCHDTFGPPVRDGVWDYHGGWIKFKDRSQVDWFLLRWSNAAD